MHPKRVGRGAGRALQRSPLLCPIPSGLGTDRCPHRTGSCVGKASRRGDDPATARRWHPGAPGRGHPGPVLSSGEIPCPWEGMGSHGGRSQGRHCAESEPRAIFGVLPLLHPRAQPAQSPGTGATVPVQRRGTAISRDAQHTPLNHPVLHTETTHPDTPHTPWISVRPHDCAALEMPPALAVGSVTHPHCFAVPAPACTHPDHPPHPRLQGRLCLLVSKPAPFPRREHSRGITGNSQIQVFPESGGVTPMGRACRYCPAGSGAAEGE